MFGTSSPLLSQQRKQKVAMLKSADKGAEKAERR
jgi:hypothetical protein